MNFDLSEEQRQIQQVSRDFARRELAPVAAGLDREGTRAVFLANLRKLAELGMMGINVRADYGGAECGSVAFSLSRHGSRSGLRRHGRNHVRQQHGLRGHPGDRI